MTAQLIWCCFGIKNTKTTPLIPKQRRIITDFKPKTLKV
jgi:hypothetical protein